MFYINNKHFQMITINIIVNFFVIYRVIFSNIEISDCGTAAGNSKGKCLHSAIKRRNYV